MTLGFSAALSLWAFEFGKDIAGLERVDEENWRGCASRWQHLRSEREKVRAIANTADSLLKAEQAAQERLAQQIRQVEAENLALKADLGFFERLLPTTGDRMNVRGLQAEVETPGQLRYQLLVMQSGRARRVLRQLRTAGWPARWMASPGPIRCPTVRDAWNFASTGASRACSIIRLRRWSSRSRCG